MIEDKISILLVDDDPGMQSALSEALKRCGYGIETASDGEEGIQKFLSGDFEMVVTDVKMHGKDGMTLLKEIKKHAPEIPVLMITAYGTIDSAIEAMKEGACDYFLKPFSVEALEEAVKRGLSRRPPAVSPAVYPEDLRGGKKRDGGGRSAAKEERGLITQDPQMLRLLNIAEHVAASQATVLIQGESGTGKELLARFIHARSSRRDRPFIAINCAAIPDGLLESELFGHERGAFTGAVQKKIGKFASADQGTLLLDEIGEMGLMLQAKLLRVLQERLVDTVGGERPIEVDIRVIATTHRNLLKEVESGRFREDLYYRLNVFPMTLPPLRERKGDILLLARHFLKKHARPETEGDAGPGISADALSFLTAHPWKGNVRELENIIERAVLLSHGKIILPEHLTMEERILGVETVSISSAGSSVREMEKALILKTLDELHGNRTRAARILGIGLRTLRNKLREYREEGAALPPG